mgnify:CR=1 FL=1
MANFLTLTKLPYNSKISLLMTRMATITSKRQLTIPVDVFNRLGLAAGDKLAIEVTDDRQLKIQKAVDLVEKLAGSLSVSPELAKMDLDEAVEKAKQLRFGRRRA